MIVYLAYIALGILIGLAINNKFERPSTPHDELEKEVTKLKSELVVYQNLKDSLLEDVKYWRNKAENK